MNWRILLAFSALTALTCPAAPRELPLKEAREEFARVDQTLNEVYRKAKEELPDHEFETVRDEQRAWIAYRDARAADAARFNSGVESGKEPSDPEYWKALSYLTETRIEILRGWMMRNDFERKWEGVWIDGYGGELSIAEDSNGEMRFTISVVRGPTYHTGAIAGRAVANEITARFSTRIDDDEAETWLTFLREDGRIRVIGENTQFYHGARAYFDGRYLRIRELTAEDRKRIESPDF